MTTYNCDGKLSGIEAELDVTYSLWEGEPEIEGVRLAGEELYPWLNKDALDTLTDDARRDQRSRRIVGAVRRENDRLAAERDLRHANPSINAPTISPGQE